MELLAVLTAGFIGVIFGRIILGRWYNHLTIYSLTLGASLTFYTFRFIEYYDISSEAWFYIVLGWIILYVGSLAVMFGWNAIYQQDNPAPHFCDSATQSASLLKFLSQVIIILSIISFIAILYQIFIILATFGSIGSAIMQGNIMYRLRVEGELSGIPYATSLPLTACCIAGFYTALKRKFTFLGVLPFILVGLDGIVVMGRTNIVIAVALWLTAMLYTPHKRFISRKIRYLFAFVSVLAIGIFMFVSSMRGLLITFKYESQEMDKMRRSLVFFPSFYLYLATPPIAFSEYLLVGEERFYPGSYTFKPMYNILAKMSLTEPLPLFNQWIKTPEPINAASYLREIHADFGAIGILIFPLLLSVLLTSLYLRTRYRPKAVYIVILAHFLAVVWLAWDINIMKLGQWAVSILVSFVIALKCDIIVKRR
jgi:oligosaccharide repeat unit polymerase